MARVRIYYSRLGMRLCIHNYVHLLTNNSTSTITLYTSSVAAARCWWCGIECGQHRVVAIVALNIPSLFSWLSTDLFLYFLHYQSTLYISTFSVKIFLWLFHYYLFCIYLCNTFKFGVQNQSILHSESEAIYVVTSLCNKLNWSMDLRALGMHLYFCVWLLFVNLKLFLSSMRCFYSLHLQ